MGYTGCMLAVLAALGAAPEKEAAAKDPVAEVFALPAGTRLGRQQQAKYAEIKSFYAPKLGEAMEKVDKAAGADRREAYAAMKKLRDEIEAQIVQILKMPGPETKTATKTTKKAAARPVARSTPRPTPARPLRATPARALRARPIRAATAR